MSRKSAGFLLGTVGFAAVQYLWQRPSMTAGARSWTVYAFLMAANAFYLYNLVYHLSAKPRWVVAAYLLWYPALFLFFVAVATGTTAQVWGLGGTHRQLLFGLFVMLTSAFFHVPLAFGFLVVALIAYFIFPFFAEPTLVLLGAFYLIALAAFRAAKRTQNYLVPACFVAGFVLFFVVIFPLIHLGQWRSPQDLDTLVRGRGRIADETRSALWMSVSTSTAATLIVLVLGVPLAYFLVRSDFRGRGVLDAMVDLPIVVPPPVAGLAIIILIGEKQALGIYLRETFGIELDSAWAGIVLAQVFVSSPFLIRSAMAAFRAVDPRLENVSRTLGAGPFRTFWRVTLPLSARGILMGCILTWGRAIGEFGSVSLVAQDPQTMPVLMYKEYVGSGGSEGPFLSLALLMVLLSVTVFAALHLVASRTLWRNVRTIWSRFGGQDISS